MTVHHPIVAEHGDRALALYGSFLPRRRADAGRHRRRSCSVTRPARVTPHAGEIELNDGRAVDRAAGDQPRRSADPGRQPLSLRRDQPRARLRSRRRRTACASTSPPAPRCASSPARRRRSRSSRSPARAYPRRQRLGQRTGCRRLASLRMSHRSAPLRRHLRPDHRRPRPPRRHRPRRRGRAATPPSTATSASSAAARCCATAWARRPASPTPTRSTA